MWRCLWLLLSLLPATLAAQTVYDGLSPTDLAPANFCAYSANSPWRQRIPPNPTHKPGAAANTIARSYITNAASIGFPWWRTSGDTDFNSCDGGYFHCRVDTGFPTFVATTNDPQVTFICDCTSTNYGCWQHDVNICQPPNFNQSWTYTGRAPANLRSGFRQEPIDSGIGDQNWAVVQPNGDVIEAYHCAIYDPVQENDQISARSGSRCNGGSGQNVGSFIMSNLQNDLGRNGGINTGPNGMAIGLKYWHTVPPAANPTSVTPNQALWMNTSCNKPTGFVYPASSDTFPCNNNDGLPTGTRLWLNLDHAGIDNVIASNPSLQPWRGILYAVHDYGLYLGDTGCSLGPDSGPALACGWLETGHQVVANGAHNRWLDWFHTLDASIINTTYQPIVYFNPFAAVVNNIEVVDECYAYPRGHTGDNCQGGTANDDRLPPETTCPGVTSTAPTVTITDPNNGNNVTVTTQPLTTLAGNATDNVGVTGVTWACPTCSTPGGTANCTGCGASGTSVTWSVPSIPLTPTTTHTITVTASDGTETGIASIQVTYNPPVSPDLVAWYQFSETARDSTSYNNHLTLQGTPVPTYVATGATYGYGLQLNGTTQYGTAPNSLTLGLTTGMTLAAWVRPSQSLTDFRSILMKHFVYLLYASSGPAGALCPTLGAPFVAIEQGSALKAACGNAALPANQWTHVAGTLNGTTLTLWINGSAVTPALTVTNAGIDASTGQLYVGNSSNTGETLPGTLDEVRVYNYALDSTAIAALATPTPGQQSRLVRHRRGTTLR